MRRANHPRPTLVAQGAVLLVALLGCGTSPPPPTASPTVLALRPAVLIEQTWTTANGEWTFNGTVDPEGDSTDVVLEIGPGPATARRFDARLPVEQGLTTAGPLTITTRAIPDIDEICVRFTATNSAGTSSSSPLCFPHDLPSIAPAAAPMVEIDPAWTVTDGEWAFTVRVDPKGDPTDVVLEIGPGPAAAAKYLQASASRDLMDAAMLTMTTKAIPDAKEVCVRFTATNSLGKASSEPLCFPHDSPGSS